MQHVLSASFNEKEKTMTNTQPAHLPPGATLADVSHKLNEAHKELENLLKIVASLQTENKKLRAVVDRANRWIRARENLNRASKRIGQVNFEDEMFDYGDDVEDAWLAFTKALEQSK